VLQQLGVYKAHFIAHDMGDSVLTTLLTRYQRNVLWNQDFENLFQSVIFTNGGMQKDFIKFKVMQSLLLISPINKLFAENLAGTRFV
jgi:hypothetical protein